VTVTPTELVIGVHWCEAVVLVVNHLASGRWEATVVYGNGATHVGSHRTKQDAVAAGRVWWQACCPTDNSLATCSALQLAPSGTAAMTP
jgi:hypothetical protein